jgi:peptide/nickel transport system ATP-binding protein
VPLIGRAQREPAAPSTGAVAVSQGCKFDARCPRNLGPVCETLAPPLQQAGPDHAIRCHIPLSELAAVPHWLGPPA